MKILCICERGNSRSVALAYIFKDVLNQDALAMGIRATTEDTKIMLYDWSDIIILVDKTFESEIPEKYQEKLHVWDVGPDRYFMGFHQDLIKQYENYINSQVTVMEHA